MSIPVPRIFISATSGDLGTVRRAIAAGLHAVGALAIEQKNFALSGSHTTAHLDEIMAQCDAIIHIAGHRYGAEDESSDLAKTHATYAAGRRSYTQHEHDYAKAHGKKLYIFLTTDAFPYDPAAPETDELGQLQLDHRARLSADQHFGHPIDSAAQLAEKLHTLDDRFRLITEELLLTSEKVDALLARTDAHAARHDRKLDTLRRYALLGTAAAVAIGGGVWMVKKQGGEIKKEVGEAKQLITDALAENRAIVARLASLYNETGELKATLTVEQKFDRAIERTAEAENKTKGEILARVDTYIANVREREKQGRADFYDLGLAAFAEKNFQKATDYAIQAADIARKDRLTAKDQKEHAAQQERTATQAEINALKLAGDAEVAAIHYPKAIAHYRTAAALCDQTAEPDQWSRVHFNLANALESNGNLPEGMEVAKRVLTHRERTLGSEHPDTLEAVNMVAILRWANGDQAGAETLYRRALEARERTLGREHPDTLNSVNNLAVFVAENGDLAAAETLYRRALEAYERTLGRDHPATSNSVNNLANLLSAKGDRGGAEPLLRRALEARERTLGGEHPNTLQSMDNLANMLSANGDRAGAEALYLRALEAQERTLGSEHPGTCFTACNAARFYQEGKDYPKAKRLAQQAYTGFQKKLGDGHKWTKMAKNLLLDLAGAEPLYLRALEAMERTLGREHPDTCLYAFNMALFYQERKDYPEAKRLAEQAYTGFQKKLGDEHEYTKAAKKLLDELRK